MANVATTRPSVRAVAAAALRCAPTLDRQIRARLADQRTRKAAAFMEVGGIYPGERAPILADYRYACTHTARGIGQSLNLESVIRDILARGIEGAFVETGTYTGGASAYAMRAFRRLGDSTREFWGFDSFEGMPQPTQEDGDQGALWITGKPLSELPVDRPGRLEGSPVNATDYDQCLAFLQGTGYPSERIHLVKGWFQDTLPVHAAEIGPIAILRLDGDLYESTKVVLEQLFDSVVSGGVVIIDDYGTFEGCRRATDEFLRGRGLNPHLAYVDVGIRYFVR